MTDFLAGTWAAAPQWLQTTLITLGQVVAVMIVVILCVAYLTPQADGWLFKVRPLRFASEAHNLMTGRAASQWLELARARLAGLFAGTPALLFPDDGFMLDNLSDRCSDEEWARVVSEIFHVETMETRQ